MKGTTSLVPQPRRRKAITMMEMATLEKLYALRMKCVEHELGYFLPLSWPSASDQKKVYFANLICVHKIFFFIHFREWIPISLYIRFASFMIFLHVLTNKYQLFKLINFFNTKFQI